VISYLDKIAALPLIQEAHKAMVSDPTTTANPEK